jgi:hypothetical protein
MPQHHQLQYMIAHPAVSSMAMMHSFSAAKTSPGTPVTGAPLSDFIGL